MLVPIMAPATVDTLSESIALSMSFIFPSEPIFPETFATLVKVPAVSKKSMKNRVKITVTIEAESAAPKSNANSLTALKYVLLTVFMKGQTC